ncbi:MAG: hypothetical protein Q3998_04035 [Porphyromonas sp.]|nr:hypothetical protein [Porphyromonas sp.]
MSRRQKLSKKSTALLGRIGMRKLMAYLFFFVLSFALWFIRAVQDTYTENVTFKLIAPEVPADISLSEPIPETVTVTITDTGSAFLRYIWLQQVKEVSLPIVFSEDRYGSVDISSQMLEKLISSQALSTSSRIERISPASITFSYTAKAKKQLPIRLSTRIEPEIGSILDSVSMSQVSAIVYGGKHILDLLKEVETDTITFTNVKDSTLLTVKLLSRRGITITPNEITLCAHTQKLVQKELEVPISVNDEEFPFYVRTFPSFVRVTCFIPENMFKHLSPRDIVITIDRDDLGSSKSGKVDIVIQEKPSYVEMIQTDPTVVEYLLEEKETRE